MQSSAGVNNRTISSIDCLADKEMMKTTALRRGTISHAVATQTQVSAQDLAQRAACAGAAALLSLGSLAAPALASEFDVLAEETPTKSYFIDDAGVLSKSTKSDLNKRLSILEVGASCTLANS